MIVAMALLVNAGLIVVEGVEVIVATANANAENANVGVALGIDDQFRRAG